MSVAAGETAEAGRIPGERIATTIATSDSSTITGTETTVDSVTAALVNGRTYRVRWVTAANYGTANDTYLAKIRQDSSSGTEMQSRRLFVDANSMASAFDLTMEVEYTASSTGNKTFVGTGVVASGGGNLVFEGASTRPRYLYVDYIRG